MSTYHFTAIAYIGRPKRRILLSGTISGESIDEVRPIIYTRIKNGLKYKHIKYDLMYISTIDGREEIKTFDLDKGEYSEI